VHHHNTSRPTNVPNELIIMPPVNLEDVPEPEELPPSPNLVAGRAFPHYASRPRARSDSLRGMMAGLPGAGAHSPPPSIREEQISRPRARSEASLRRIGGLPAGAHSPPPSIREEEVVTGTRLRSDSFRKRFQTHGRSSSSPPSMNEVSLRQSGSGSLPPAVEEDGSEEEKQEENANDLQRQDSVTSGSSPRTKIYSERSLVVDDDDTTIAGADFDFDSPLSADPARSSIADTGPNQRYLFGYALPLWCTTRPNAERVTTGIAKYAPCFWCSRERLSLTTTNQAILLRLAALCGFLGLCQAGSASYLLVVLLSDTIVDRNSRYVDRTGTARTEAVPSLWNINTFVLSAGVLGALVFIIMLFARRVFRELDLTGSLRFMWCMLWIIPLEVFCTVGMFGRLISIAAFVLYYFNLLTIARVLQDYHRVSDVWITHWWTARCVFVV